GEPPRRMVGGGLECASGGGLLTKAVIVAFATRRSWNARRDQSGLMPAVLITLAHFSVSSAMSFSNSVGVMGIGTSAKSASRAFILGSARPAVISLLILSMTSAGVPRGAPTPNHAVIS